MSEDLFFKRDALSNNTYDLTAVIDSINQIQMSSFKYLHQIQIDMTCYKRFDFKMQDAQRSNTINHLFSLVPRRWVLYVQDDFIHEGKRFSYRRSKYYEKEISYDDTLNNRDIFDSTFLVFIDGKLYFEGVNILCKEDKTYCIFNLKEKPADKGIEKMEFKRMMDENVNVTVFFIPNYKNQNISTNAYMLRNANKREGLEYSKFESQPSGDAICFARTMNSPIGELMETSLTDKGVKTDDVMLSNIINSSPRDTTMYLNFLEFKYLHEVVEIGTGETDSWFELELQDYPIAVNNCIIFDEEGNFMHDLEIDMYYPNIYNIRGDRQNKKLKVYIFYFKSNMILKHRNSLAVFYKYTRDVLDRYKRDSIPEIIKKYNPQEIIYDIKDYHGSVYYDDHFKYKTEKMRTLTRIDAEYFRDYLINLALKNKYFFIDVSKIKNLAGRIRHDNSDTKNGNIITFDEPMYMFVFANDYRDEYDYITVMVDGLRQSSNHIYATDKYDFIYLPVRLVPDDAIIEVEKFKEVIKSLPFIGKGDYRTTITLDDECIDGKVLMNDIFITDVESNKYLSHDDYELYARVGDDMINIVKEDLFLRAPREIEIKIVNPDYMEKQLVCNIAKNYKFDEVYTHMSGKDNLLPIEFEVEMLNDPRHLRLYRNGRVVPRHIFTCEFPEEFEKSQVRLYCGMMRQNGDEYVVEAVPYKMRQVAFYERIEKNKIIELTGKIDKPFDLRWYDLYLNGRKMNKFEVEIISSNKIVIRSTKSLKNLEIVENSRDDEYFGYFPLKDLIDDILDSDDDDGFRERIEETIKDMNDDEESVITDIVTEIDALLSSFYWNYMVPFYGLINPDYMQIDAETHYKYRKIMDGDPFLLNGDYGRLNAKIILHVNPDYDVDNIE